MNWITTPFSTFQAEDLEYIKIEKICSWETARGIRNSHVLYAKLKENDKYVPVSPETDDLELLAEIMKSIATQLTENNKQV